MLAFFFLNISHTMNDEIVLIPANSQEEFLILHKNLSLRVVNKMPNVHDYGASTIKVMDLQNGFKALKIEKQYICAPEQGNYPAMYTSFKPHKCSWIIEENHDGTFSIKIGNSYFSVTDEIDTRPSSIGWKLRLLPSTSDGKLKWEFKKAGKFFNTSDNSDEEETNPKEEVNKEKKNNKDKQSVVLGVSTRPKTDLIKKKVN